MHFRRWPFLAHVVGDEVADLSLKIAGQIEILEQDAVLERLVSYSPIVGQVWR